MSIARDDPSRALSLVGALDRADVGPVAVRIGDVAMLRGDAGIAGEAYTRAGRVFRSYTWERALGRACSHYGLALVAYGLCDWWQAFGEIDAGLACLREWVTLQNHSLVAVLESLGQDIRANSFYWRC